MNEYLEYRTDLFAKSDYKGTFRININITIIIIEMIVLLILTIGLVLLFADKKNMGKPAYKKE
ncbi:MAG: hypothetical protein L6428_09735 [Candidatus Aminicenantes bacterium]|nr:hypothetical protein [Candidatus Aminicenantes bacterium]